MKAEHLKLCEESYIRRIAHPRVAESMVCQEPLMLLTCLKRKDEMRCHFLFSVGRPVAIQL